MSDFKFDWDNSMNTGIETIDLQHKELFKIARTIEQFIIINVTGVNQKDMIDVISEIRNYVSYHFYEEERIMQEYNYSNYIEHKKVHDDFQAKVVHISCKNLLQNPYSVLLELKDKLQDWVFNHIMVEDYKMAQEIKNHIKS